MSTSTITYELALALKNAGFPQKGVNWIWRDDSGKWIEELEENLPDDLEELKENKNLYVPTLSELIEACGDRFECLSKVEDQWWVDERGGFFSNGETATYGGSTPEEAVAELWLALNKPK